ncbi:hypothetical protein Bca52824_035824 [Brassica carinata]|uniref:Zinc knuckle CX2CX4HX4C domain-containing protein n=1 Tax=Brassica carinata TaxID=52824 RepID=A0A8X7S447_BRACI|nr:hypothetical protein Bca52824_035824 [Brassica carinata]
MVDNLRRAIQDLNLGIDDAPVPLSVAVCNEARRVNQFSLIGRPIMQTSKTRKFQIVFLSEEMLLSVINRGPWAFNERMVIISRWVSGMDDDDLNYIPLWMQIRGIPFEYLSEPVICNIGDRMGEVMTVDFNPNVNAAVEFVRVRLNWNFSPGFNTLLKFRYERLKGFCDQCRMITHDSGPLANEEDPQNGQAEGEVNEAEGMVEPEGPVEDIHMDQGQNGATFPGSNVALLQQFSSLVPMDLTSHEYERSVGEARMKRRNDLFDALLEEGSSSLQKTSDEEVGLSQEDESDEDSDHIILEMEARRSSDFDFSQYGSFLQDDFDHRMAQFHASMRKVDDPGASMKGSCLGKRIREESEKVDKYPVGRMKVSHEFNALRKLQEDYGQEQVHGSTPQINRGAVGPVPPDEP